MTAALDFGVSGDAVADADGRKLHFPGRGDANGVEDRGRHGAGENDAANGRFSMGAETVQCIECRFFAFKGAGELARHGFGNCQFQPRWRFASSSFPRRCGQFFEANAAVVEKRIQWLREQQKSRGAYTQPIQIAPAGGAQEDVRDRS